MFKIGFLIGALSVIGFGIYGVYTIKTKMAVQKTTKPVELAQLELEDTKGGKLTVQTGKPLVVNFWATWCAPCVKEFPEFEELKNKYADKVDFLMVSDEDAAKIEQFKAKKGYTLNMVRSSKTFDQYGMYSIPVTRFYNAKGQLIQTITGGLTKEDLEAGVHTLIENK